MTPSKEFREGDQPLKIKKKILISWLLGFLSLGLVMVLLGWTLALYLPTPGNRNDDITLVFTPELIERGAYLARVGDCMACHSQPNQPRLSGGVAIESPIGGMVPPNITPDPKYGIGNYTYGDFVRALRYGVNQKNETLYPAMPWPSYAKIADSDLQAMYAFFMKGVTPVAQKSDANTIAWPFSMRWPVTYWRWLFGPTVSATATPPASGEALGSYLVESLGHCGACHTPRGIGMQEKALDNGSVHYLSGGQVIDGFAAPSLRGEPNTGLGGITAPDIAQILKTGHSSKGHAIFGGMSDVVVNSTQYMTDSDLLAMASYLKSLKPKTDETPLHYETTTMVALEKNDFSQAGAKVYQQKCMGCHLSNGLGYEKGFPALALNPAVMNPNPVGLIRLILQGQTLPRTQENFPAYFMPAFANQLSDQDIADVTTFIRNAWGNKASQVSDVEVSDIRVDLKKNQ